jgi:hypothetical protein
MITKASTIIGPRSNRRYCGRACWVSWMRDMRGLLAGRLARKASKELRDRPPYCPGESLKPSPWRFADCSRLIQEPQPHEEPVAKIAAKATTRIRLPIALLLAILLPKPR